MAFCTNCGTQLRDGARFCPACGAPVTGGQPAPNPAPSQPFAPQPTPAQSYAPQQAPAQPFAPQQAPAQPYGAQSAAPRKPMNKGVLLIGCGALALVAVVVVLILLLGGSGKQELTMEQFIDKYIEAYKAKGSWEHYVGDDEEANYRKEILEGVETLTGEPSEDNIYGAITEAGVRIRREEGYNPRIIFAIYPDEKTAEAAFPQIEAVLKEDSGMDVTAKSEGRNSESLTYPITEENDTFVRVVRVGKTLMMISCTEDEALVSDLFEIFGY